MKQFVSTEAVISRVYEPNEPLLASIVVDGGSYALKRTRFVGPPGNRRLWARYVREWA